MSERAALFYLMSLPHADRCGYLTLEADVAAVEYGGICGVRWGWTPDVILGCIQELTRVGLWLTQGTPRIDPGRTQSGVAKVCDFEVHNRPHPKEAESELERKVSGKGLPRVDPGLTQDAPKVDPFPERGVEESEGKAEGRGVDQPTPPLPDASSNGDTWNQSEEETRIRLSLVPAMPPGWYPSGMESYRIREYARGGACRRWPGDELRAHLCAQADKIAAKRGRRPDGLYLLNQINADWDPPAPRRSNAGPPEQVYEDWTGRGQAEDPFAEKQ